LFSFGRGEERKAGSQRGGAPSLLELTWPVGGLDGFAFGETIQRCFLMEYSMVV
jgi:hypothetical protein